MSNFRDRDREVPAGQKRKTLRAHESVHSYVTQQRKENDRTISEELTSYLPPDWDEIEFGYENEKIAHLKVTPAVKNRIESMTGTNVSQGDVLTLFVMLAALRNGDLEEAAEMSMHTPELVWDMLSDVNQSVLARGSVDE